MPGGRQTLQTIPYPPTANGLLPSLAVPSSLRSYKRQTSDLELQLVFLLPLMGKASFGNYSFLSRPPGRPHFIALCRPKDCKRASHTKSSVFLHAASNTFYTFLPHLLSQKSSPLPLSKAWHSAQNTYHGGSDATGRVGQIPESIYGAVINPGPSS